jgi:hypothetical protein
MIKRIRIGVVLMLIGIGIPLVLVFFQKDGELFNIKITKYDKLREAEVKTLNSFYDLSKLYEKEVSIAFGDKPPAVLSTSQMEASQTFWALSGTFKEIEDLLRKAEIPNTGRIDKQGGKVIPPLPPGFVLDNPDGLGKFVLLAPVKYTAGIPFNYSIGVGLIFFITGIGFVILSLIGRKGRTS